MRDLSCGDTRVWLAFEVRRIDCRTCGTVKTERLDWLADTSQGRMVGDYFGLTFTGGRALAVVVLPRPRHGGRFDEALYAVSTPPR